MLAAVLGCASPVIVAEPPAPPAAGERILTGESTLAAWVAADAADRAQVAVAMAKARLAPDASKLEIATAAMEITGCLSATAQDTRFLQWKVAPTAATCLSAPERPHK